MILSDANAEDWESMPTQTKDSQAKISPAEALDYLRQGNQRFQANLKAERDLLEQVKATQDGQWPIAAVLSCIDSRTSSELIFDLGLGDIFSLRLAGNCVNDDILGSLEFACKIAGSKLIVVLGHSKCGAVKGACQGVEMGHLTGLLEKIQPAVEAVKQAHPDLSPEADAFHQAVAESHVRQSMDVLRERSPVLLEMEQVGEIAIVGGMYDISTGAVHFFETDNS
jgi:carbonic anhydrase